MAKKKFLLAAILVLFHLQVGYALDQIPQKSGFSGFARLGIGSLWYKNNLVAGNSLMDVGSTKINNLNESAGSETTAMGLVNFEAAYTFSNTRTQIILGSQLEDLVQMDLSQQLAVNQELADKSIIMAGFLFSGIPSEVWKDPYITDNAREETDRDSSGIRLTFDRILGSNFEVSYTWRDIDIDKEESGNYLELSPLEKNLLRRDGLDHKIDITYRYTFQQKHVFMPSLNYLVYERDGDAMSSTKIDFQLSYFFLNDPITLIVNGLVGKAKYDAVHPLFGVTREDDRYSASIQIYYKNPFGWKPLGRNDFSVFAMNTYVIADANIDFYDSNVNAAIAGVMFRF